MTKNKLPKELIKSRIKTWTNTYLFDLLKEIPSRHRKVLSKIDFTKQNKSLAPTYLCGKVRTGKTIKAWQMVLEWHCSQYSQRLSRDFIFISITELLAEFRNSYSNQTTTEEKILKKYKKVKLLVLDDFGAEKTTEWAYQMLYMVLSYRYDYEMITIYTSNFSLNELSKRLGDDRLSSRITHECKGNIINFTNKPYV